MKLVFTCIVFVILTNVVGQLPLDDIDFNKISQESVKEYIEEQKEHDIHCFSDIIASCFVEKDMSDYSVHMASYIVKDNINNVWNAYKKASPSKIWNGRTVSFGFLYSRKSDNVLYRNTNFAGLEVGQIIYVNIKLFKGLYNLATAFEIVNVDNKNRIISFSYLNGGRAKGIQTIRFVETKRGHTRIIHTTEYKSNSYIRDRYLYGHFHKKCINQFHHNVRKLVYGKKHKSVHVDSKHV